MGYSVKEIFDTLQGEGGRAGERSIFVRLGGCNYWSGRAEDRERGKAACAEWCDTDFFGGTKMEASAIVERCAHLWPAYSPTRWVVLTGGEPLLQLDTELLAAFHTAGFSVAVETNGSIAPIDGIDWLTVSPKLGSPWALAARRGQEMKVVLPGSASGSGWPSDVLEGLRKETTFGAYYVQPQDPIDEGAVDASFLKNNLRVFNGHGARYKQNLERCIAFVREHPEWRLSLQSHKWTGLP